MSFQSFPRRQMQNSGVGFRKQMLVVTPGEAECFRVDKLGQLLHKVVAEEAK